MLRKYFTWYLEHQDELVKDYNGKSIAIKDFMVIGAYNSDSEAVDETQKKYPLGTFIVQKCTPGPDAYTCHFNSRVTFA